MWPKWRENKPFVVALLVILAAGVVYLGVKTCYTVLQSARLDKPVPYEHTIMVDGVGKVSGQPDIASVSFGVESRADSVAQAQNDNTKLMNGLIAKMKELGIAAADIKTTNYNSYQDYQWDPDKQVSEPKGWIVSQYVTVKVRDLALTAAVLEAAGQNGATNISGPNFVLDDPDALKAEARAEALQNAQQKARDIAKKLGLKLEKVIGYSEWSPDATPYYAYDMGKGMGGGAPAPEILPGTNDVTINVSITYKLVD